MNRNFANFNLIPQSPTQKMPQAFFVSGLGNRAIGQSGNRAIGQSGNRAIGQSGNRAIGQSGNYTPFHINCVN
jgi:hypothetical protein